MPILNLSPQGRFGNVCMQFLFCRALAERYRYTLHCDEWIGEKAFDVSTPRYSGPPLPRLNEITIFDHIDRGIDLEFRGYAQMQKCMVYTKRQAQEWLKIRSEWLPALGRIGSHRFSNDSIVAHHRKGDFAGYNYPMISRLSYQQTAHFYFVSGKQIEFVSEEEPTPRTDLPDDLTFLPDFYRLMNAPTLMRANSTFSFIAALLGNGLVLSPRIDGLVGGIEHDNVHFEAGNHCKLADFDFCSDLYITP